MNCEIYVTSLLAKNYRLLTNINSTNIGPTHLNKIKYGSRAKSCLMTAIDINTKLKNKINSSNYEDIMLSSLKKYNDKLIIIQESVILKAHKKLNSSLHYNHISTSLNSTFSLRIIDTNKYYKSNEPYYMKFSKKPKKV